MLPEFEEANTQVLGVSADSWAANGAFQKEAGLTFPLLSDWPRFNAMQTLGIMNENAPTAQRVTFVIDREGVLRGRIQDVELEEHAREALRQAKEMNQS